MSSTIDKPPPVPPVPDERTHQFRLARLQTYNWGTFSGLVDLMIPDEGYLFVGASGSGKSTLLDAHACLLTPPKWVDFNVAARENERSGKDRSLLTYVRGAWAQQTGEGREVVAQFLRPDSTWTAIAETYRNGEGRVIVLAQVLWVKGKTALATDVQRLYLVLTETLDLAALEFFPRHDFDVRRFKHELPQAFLAREFSAYQERFRGLLGIAGERALRLLHKTQSAKNLGDLNTFLRDFMLDAPETFEVADRLVAEFGELNAAHQAVVAARRQIETLAPAEEEYAERERGGVEKLRLAEQQAGLDAWRHVERERLAIERVAELGVAADGAEQKTRLLDEAAGRESDKLAELKGRRRDHGGQRIDDLQRQINDVERERPERVRKRELARAACEAMGWTLPDDVVAFVQRNEAAREHVRRSPEHSREVEARKDELKQRKVTAEKAFEDIVREVRAMERRRSNIPSRLLDLRERIARALGLSEERLPFAGELLQVKTGQTAWQGAIERVLGGFARSMLVEERHYGAVTAWLEEHDTGERLFYNRMLPQQAGARTPGPASLVRKLDLAPGAERAIVDWLREELKVHFDFECAETLLAFRAAPRAVTKQGQVKRDSTRHEKNDRQRIDDRSHWVLGFDNRDKRELFEAQATELASTIAGLGRELGQLAEEDKQVWRRDQACTTLQNLSWNDIDVVSLVALAADLGARLDAERSSRPDLEALERWIAKQEKVHQQAVAARNESDAQARALRAQIEKLQSSFAATQEDPSVALTPTQAAGLQERRARVDRVLDLDTLDDVARQIERGLAGDLRTLDVRLTELRSSIEQRLMEFNRLWPADGGGLDATLAAANDYFDKLARLRTDGLPRYEQRFFRLLREQSDQNLTLLASKIEQERSAIRQRMELVNESLLGAPFNPGTHLVIDTLPRELAEVQQFKQALREALSHSLGAADESTDKAVAERRFALLNDLVRRLASQEHAERRWRELVLDVRQHVEFMGRELDDASGDEIEAYRSGAGKSGGQRQKLASTCLAAALRYQLSSTDRALPSFATVVLDEAFDKADADFTRTAMNIFTTFGFQMIVATPLKSVMTLEPFVGGACVVHISERRTSSVLRIDYDHDERRLRLPRALLGEDVSVGPAPATTAAATPAHAPSASS
jgi:uncharacterized protein YPO0396